jgi:hypothetical protein
MGFSGKIPASLFGELFVRSKLTIVLFALIFLVSCTSPGRATSTPTPPAPTPSPTASPTPTMPLVILVLPADMAQEQYDQYQTLVYDLAQANGIRFQVLNTLTPDDLALVGSALKIVIALPPDPGLAALTSVAPGVQFLAVGIPDLAPASNLSTIGANGIPVDQQAFLAGYIAGMVAPEWKTGILYQKDTPGGETARNAFINGFTFYCGTCRNDYFSPPVGVYPILIGIPADAPVGDYPGHTVYFRSNNVKVVYIYPEITNPGILDYITQNTDMLVIGETPPDDENSRTKWIVSIRPDLIASIKNIFSDLVAGNGGQVIPTPLFLADVNPDLLSEGKLRMVQQVLDGLQNGTIGTGATP